VKGTLEKENLDPGFGGKLVTVMRVSAARMSQKCQPVRVGCWDVGASPFVVIAGPCSIESEKQWELSARAALKAGAVMLRGGINKLRTHPDSFQGLGREAIQIVRNVLTRVPLPFVSEVTDPRDLEWMDEVVDVYQVGTRNMYNYALLKELARSQKPVILKRAFSATIGEWLHASEYLVRGGNTNIILCERGIRTFEQAMRNTLDLSAVAYIKQTTPFPVIVDPSHATGLSELVEPMSLAAAAAGADGLLVEAHPNPNLAFSDARQAIDFESLAQLVGRLEPLLHALGRELARSKIDIVDRKGLLSHEKPASYS
jgi:3-deoxy-7-phosphoheptulonate synthase